MFHVNRRDRNASTAPNAQNAPDTRESCSRAATLPRWTEVELPLRSRGRRYPQKPKWRHTSALYTERELEQFFHPPLLAANYIHANISGCPNASISCHCLSSGMKTAL